MQAIRVTAGLFIVLVACAAPKSPGHESAAPVQPPALPGAAPERFVYEGVVVSEGGEPVADARVVATHRMGLEGKGGYGYIDAVKTDAAGRFSINRERGMSGASPAGLDKDRIRVDVTHKDFLFQSLEGVRHFTPEQARNIKVTLLAGRTLRGRVVDAGNKPVAGARVQGNFGDDYRNRKAVGTGDDGSFEIRGVPPELDTTLEALVTDSRSPAMSGRLAVPALKGGDADAKARDGEPLTLRVEPIKLPPGTAVHEVLGMKLVDLTEPLCEAFHVGNPAGVMVLDPGPDAAERLGVGRLERGDTFWMVGNTKVKNVAEFKRHLLEDNEKSPKANAARCRVVYGFDRLDRAGSNTQYMLLTKADLASLRGDGGVKK